MPIILCEYCNTIEQHNKKLGDENKISPGDFVEWSTGEFGDVGTFGRGTVVKKRSVLGTYGHLQFLIDKEWGEERVWIHGQKIWRVGERN